MQKGEGRKEKKGSPQNIPRDPWPASSWNPLVSIHLHHSAMREPERSGILLERKKAAVDLGKYLVALL